LDALVGKGGWIANVALWTRNGDAGPPDIRGENVSIQGQLRRANIAFFRVMTTYFFSLHASTPIFLETF